jgi:galactose-1-phosphate uridylyltransferase
MIAENQPELIVTELETGRFMVPFFMRRPYNLLYVPENPEPSHLYQTSAAERADLGRALATGMRLTEGGLRAVGREQAYNVVFHTGAGAGIYLEFLPRTQEDGGFEQLGLSACQASPFDVAARLRESV